MHKTTPSSQPTDKLLPRLTLFFFDRPWMTLAIWLVLLVFGILSYTTFLKRDGFPSINIPVVVTTGTYAKDAASVDTDLAKPLSDIALKQMGVTSVQTTSQDNFVQTSILYEESVDTDTAKKELEKAVEASGKIPPSAKLSYTAPYFGATGGSLEKIDATVSLFDDKNITSTQDLTARANEAVKYLNQHKGSQVERYFVQSPFAEVPNPATGQTTQVQRTFDRFARL